MKKQLSLLGHDKNLVKLPRLTERDEYGNADIIGVESVDLYDELRNNEINLVTEALNKLAMLEDIEEELGMTIIEYLQKEHEREVLT